MAEPATADVELDWRDDPGWVLVECMTERFDEPPAKPTAAVELANPALWASAFDESGRRIIASWFRPTVSV